MARPRKNPDDHKWQHPSDPKWPVGSSEQILTLCKRCGKESPADVHTCTPPEPWQMYFAAALTGLIARGGLSPEQMIKTAMQYADEAQTLITSPLK